jgi:hypothetical protein
MQEGDYFPKLLQDYDASMALGEATVPSPRRQQGEG